MQLNEYMDIDEAYNVGLEIVQSHEGPAEDPQSQDHVPSSNVELIKPIDVEDSNPMQDTEHYQAQSSSPQLAAPDDDDDSPAEELEALNPASVEKRGIAVIVPAVQNPWEYLVYEEPRVREVLEEFDDGSNIKYLVEFEDGREDVVSSEFAIYLLIQTSCGPRFGIPIVVYNIISHVTSQISHFYLKYLAIRIILNCIASHT